MSDQLWNIALALHQVEVHDRNSLDILAGCIAIIISLASDLEREEQQGKRGPENG